MINLLETSNIEKMYPATKANKQLAQSGIYINPPYTPGTTVFEVSLKQETTFARVYNKYIQGQFATFSSEIEGLKATQVGNKLALEYTPIYKAKVIVPEETRVRIGFINKNYGKEGGGIQIDFMGTKLAPDKFIEEGDIK